MNSPELTIDPKVSRHRKWEKVRRKVWSYYRFAEDNDPGKIKAQALLYRLNEWIEVDLDPFRFIAVDREPVRRKNDDDYLRQLNDANRFYKII